MTDADKAFAVAAKMIADAQREGATRLDLDTDETRALTDLPSGIADLTGLQTLDLNNTQIGDAGLAQIAGLTGLRWLDLRNTQIGDAGLAQIAGLAGLQVLWLDNTQVTDAGLSQIVGLNRLLALYLDNTQVSDLRLLRGFNKLLEPQIWGGLRLAGCAAAKADPQIAKIAAIEGDKARAQALFDLIDAGWVPPGAGTGQQPNPPEPRPAPLEVEIIDHRLVYAAGGALRAGAKADRAREGWEALREFRDDFVEGVNVSNYRPLASALRSFSRALANRYEDMRTIALGHHGQRLNALAQDEEFLASLPDGVATELAGFAVSVMTYLERFPKWQAYLTDTRDSRPVAADVQEELTAFLAITDALDAAEDVDEDVKKEFRAEAEEARDAPASEHAAQGLLASTRETLRVLAEDLLMGLRLYRDSGVANGKALGRGAANQAKEFAAVIPGEIRKKTFWFGLGVGYDLFFNKAQYLLALSAKFPAVLGWVGQIVIYLQKAVGL